MTALPLYRLGVKCRCGRTPAIRVTQKMRELAEHAHPDETLQTIQCKCGETYIVTAEAIQNAA